MSEMWNWVNSATQPITWCRLPGNPEQDGLPTELFLPAGGPRFFGDQVRDSDALATTPDASRGVEGQLFIFEVAVSASLWFAAER